MARAKSASAGTSLCVCGGSNENCRYCYGRGYVRRSGAGSEEIMLMPNEPTRLTRSRAGTRNLVTCPYCAQAVSRIQRHILRCPRGPHADLAHRRSEPKGLAPPGVSLSEPDLQSNRPADREISEPGARQSKRGDRSDLGRSSADSARRGITLTKCPKCDTPLKLKNLSRHLQSKCPKRTTRPAEMKNRIQLRTRLLRLPPDLQAAPRGAVKKFNSRFDLVNNRERMDATKNYGYPCRETGRYGSHSSHDGFDDESGPD